MIDVIKYLLVMSKTFRNLISNAQYFGSLLLETNITGKMKRPPNDYDLVIDYCSYMVAIAIVRHIVDSSNLDVKFSAEGLSAELNILPHSNDPN